MQPSGPTGGESGATVDLHGEDCRTMFVWLWEELSSAIGTPATAAILRRAIASLDNDYPELRRIAIARERLTYTYELPDDLGGGTTAECVPAFRALAGQTLHLVSQLTGGVMARRLFGSEELARWRISTLEGRYL